MRARAVMSLLAFFPLVLVACPKPAAISDEAVVDASVAVVDAGAPTIVTASATASTPAPTSTHSAAASQAKPTASTKSAAKAPTYTCKPAEVDNGDGCYKRCDADKDCAKPMKCMSMMVANPNGGTSSAMTCQKP